MKLEKIIFLGKKKEIESLQKAIEVLPENTISTYGYTDRIEYDLIAHISSKQIVLSTIKEKIDVSAPVVGSKATSERVEFNYENNTYRIGYFPISEENMKYLFYYD